MRNLFLVFICLIAFNLKSQTITVQPTARDINSGQSQVLALTASGVNLTYQWYKNGMSVNGATSRIHNTGTLTTGSYIYYCVVKSGLDSVISNRVYFCSITNDTSSLFGAARRKGINFGSMIQRDWIANGNNQYLTFVDTNFQRVTFGTNMNSFWTARNTYNFTFFDSAATWGERHGKILHFNTIVWYRYYPSWITSGGYTDSVVRVMMVESIDTLVKRYKGRIQEWEVCNEVSEYGTTPYKTTTNPWELHAGPHHWKYAYAAARAADSTATLFYNDYDMESTDDYNGKGNNFYKLLTLMNADTTQIDKIGFQSHFVQDTNCVMRNATITNQIQRIKNFGYGVTVTELDIRIPVPRIDTLTALNFQAKQYSAYVKQSYKKGIRDFTIWGFDDSTSWINVDKPGYGLACLFYKWNGSFFPPKPAYYDLKKLIASISTTSSYSTDGRIKIVIDPTCISSKQDSFPLIYNLSNITNNRFWSRTKIDGSDIYLVDTLNNVIPSYITDFNRFSKMGKMHLTLNNIDTSYLNKTSFYIVYGDVNHTTPNDSMAIRNGKVKVEFDLNAANTTLPDLTKRVLIDSVYNFNQIVKDSTFFGYSLHTFGNSYFRNRTTSDTFKISNGSMSVIFYEDTAGSRYLMSMAQSNQSNRVMIYQNSTSNGLINAVTYIAGSSTFFAPLGAASTNDSMWHYLNITWDTTKLTLSLDGRLTRINLGNRSPIWTGNMFFNLFCDASQAARYRGSINFYRLYDGVKDKNYISSEYNMTMDNNNFFETLDFELTKIKNSNNATIYGTNYGSSQGEVRFNAITMPITSWSNDSIRVNIQGMGRGYYTYKVYNSTGTLVDSIYHGVRIITPRITRGE